jgi:hypothetical protein
VLLRIVLHEFVSRAPIHVFCATRYERNAYLHVEVGFEDMVCIRMAMGYTHSSGEHPTPQ